jgi:hypothetical protein
VILVVFGIGMACLAASSLWLSGLTDNPLHLRLFAMQIATLLVTTVGPATRLAWGIECI